MRRLQPGRVVRQDDGSLLAPGFGDTYASRAGALAQSRMVFLAGCRLPERLDGRLHTVLETGFGTGLNALALAQAAQKRQRAHDTAGQTAGTCHVHYVGIEGHPLVRDDLAAALEPFAELDPWRAALLAGWPPPMAGVFRWSLDPGFTLTLVFGDVLPALRDLQVEADSVFLDGFAPDRNPAMWTPSVLAEVVAHCRPGARLASWCVAGEVRRALQTAGCVVERRPGFGGKRERLEAALVIASAAGGHRGASPLPEAAAQPLQRNGGDALEPLPERALVIGAGIAGASVAAALALRGIDVTVAEAEHPGAGASGNPLGVVRPEPSGPDHPISRLTAMGSLWLRGWVEGRTRPPPTAGAVGRGVPVPFAERCGALRLPRDDKHARRLREHAEAAPTGWMEWLSAAEAAERVGAAVAGDGVWIAECWSVSPRDVLTTLLATPGVRLRAAEATALKPLAAGGVEVVWSDGDSEVWPLVVLANAFALAGHRPLPLRRVRGQLSWVAQRSETALRAVVCREGYVTPAVGGRHLVGATFQRDDVDLGARDADDRANEWRLARLLPGWVDRACSAARVSLRAATPDRLPLVGALAPGLYASLGHGSRGLTCAPLCGELLASMVCGEPWPLPRELVRRLDPLRFGEIESQPAAVQTADD